MTSKVEMMETTIPKGRTVRIQDGKGLDLTVVTGSLWVTYEHDTKDFVLQPGRRVPREPERPHPDPRVQGRSAPDRVSRRGRRAEPHVRRRLSRIRRERRALDGRGVAARDPRQVRAGSHREHGSEGGAGVAAGNARRGGRRPPRRAGRILSPDHGEGEGIAVKNRPKAGGRTRAARAAPPPRPASRPPTPRARGGRAAPPRERRAVRLRHAGDQRGRLRLGHRQGHDLLLEAGPERARHFARGGKNARGVPGAPAPRRPVAIPRGDRGALQGRDRAVRVRLPVPRPRRELALGAPARRRPTRCARARLPHDRLDRRHHRAEGARTAACRAGRQAERSRRGARGDQPVGVRPRCGAARAGRERHAAVPGREGVHLPPRRRRVSPGGRLRRRVAGVPRVRGAAPDAAWPRDHHRAHRAREARRSHRRHPRRPRVPACRSRSGSAAFAPSSACRSCATTSSSA